MDRDKQSKQAAALPVGAESGAAAEDVPISDEPERRRCAQCGKDRPRGAYSDAHWEAINRGGERRRRCFHCAPGTVPKGTSFYRVGNHLQDPSQFSSSRRAEPAAQDA